MAQKKSIKRNIIEWTLIIGVFAVLYLTGLHTEVIGRLQQAILWTGLMKPNLELAADKQIDADYNFQLKSLDGKNVNLAELKGKVIFMNFWASWCPPCRAEMPGIQNLYNALKQDKNIAFVMISLDNEVSKAQNFIREKNFTFPAYTLASNPPQVYYSDIIPTTFVISPEGKIILRENGIADYNSKTFKDFLLKYSKQ